MTELCGGCEALYREAAGGRRGHRCRSMGLTGHGRGAARGPVWKARPPSLQLGRGYKTQHRPALIKEDFKVLTLCF